jgi:acyl-homoserine-lactone acylase
MRQHRAGDEPEQLKGGRMRWIARGSSAPRQEIGDAPRRRGWTAVRSVLRPLALAVAVAAVVGGTVSPAGAGSERGRQHDRLSAVVRYTEHGIPHVLASDYAGLGYGYGHSIARDNICVLADLYVTLRAERSSLFGPDQPPAEGHGVPVSGAATNLSSDLYFQAVNDSGIVEELIARPAPAGPDREARELIRGYVAGYNR